MAAHVLGYVACWKHQATALGEEAGGNTLALFMEGSATTRSPLTRSPVVLT